MIHNTFVYNINEEKKCHKVIMTLQILLKPLDGKYRQVWQLNIIFGNICANYESSMTHVQ